MFTPLVAALGLLAVLVTPILAQGGSTASGSRAASAKAAIDVPVSNTTGVPSAVNSTVPVGIVLVGSKDGVPDPSGLFSVTIRDLANNPLVGLPVEIDFTDAPDLVLGGVQLHPGVSLTQCNRVSASTDVNGGASFIILGSGAGRYAAPASFAGAVKVRAGGVLIASLTAAAYDLDGANGVDGADLAAWLCDFGLSQPIARADYDHIGGVSIQDLPILLNAITAGNSSQSAAPCSGVPGAPPAPVLVTGGLGLGWDNCRTSGAGNADKFSDCLSNTGSFHLVASLTPRTPTDLADVNVIETEIDVVNPDGPLPDWWRLQVGGCRPTALGVADPNNSATITCTLSGVPQTSVASIVYPFNGDPNTQRIRVTTILTGGATLLSPDQTAVLDITINRSKSTGVGLCAGCEVPVQLVLRSMRVSRGDPCTVPADARPPVFVFEQLSGSNVARWQSATPTFPVAIDATALTQYSQFQVGGGQCFPGGAVQNLTLTPGLYQFAGCFGGATCPVFDSETLLFEVDGAGHIAYASELEGALNGAGTTTLVVKSFTFPPVADDVAPSRGLFRVVVEPAFWGLMSGYPGYAVVNGVHRLVSPALFDPNTLIGRSSPHTHGSLVDNAGVPVGTAGTIVSDASFAFEPPGFQGPAATAEVHTEIRSLNMTHGQGLAQVAVRAGIDAPSRPISPGEIEAVPGVTGLFPAESFFNVFVEVDLPLIGTLYNASNDPLVVENAGIDCFPPQVVYMHRHTGPVSILFKSDDTQLPKRWLAGQRFGWLVLAGHGINFDTVTVAPANGAFGRRQVQVDPFAVFEDLVNAEPEMADTATLVVDVHDVLTFSAPSAFTAAAFRDSLMNGIDLAAALGQAGNPCAALFEATRMHQRVDSLASPSDWVVDQAVRRALADRIFALSAQLLAQANQSGGCPGVLETPPARLPTRLALLGIQPNPSFGASTIRYALPTRERVNLSVFDLSGRLVRTLVDAELPAGTYQAVWDGHQDRAGGRTVSSGTYFVRLMARGRMESRRVVIIR